MKNLLLRIVLRSAGIALPEVEEPKKRKKTSSRTKKQSSRKITAIKAKA